MEPIIPERQSRTFTADRRRSCRRFAIAVQVLFSWTDPDGLSQAGQGTTRDISIDGIFINTRAVPIPGSSVEFDLRLPSRVTRGVEIRLRGTGTVLRFDPPDSQPLGFAAQAAFCLPGAGMPFDTGSELDIH